MILNVGYSKSGQMSQHTLLLKSVLDKCKAFALYEQPYYEKTERNWVKIVNHLVILMMSQRQADL